jgi:hypothetical protein
VLALTGQPGRRPGQVSGENGEMAAAGPPPMERATPT